MKKVKQWPGKYMKFYFDSLKEGKMVPYEDNYETSGLCDAFYGYGKYDEYFSLMRPTAEDYKQLAKEGKSNSVWASDCPKEDINEFFVFNPLRQNIVLFMAAMAGELD